MMACMGEEDFFFLQWRELIDLRGLNGTCVAGQLLTWELCMADRSRCKLCYKQTSAGGAAIATTAQVRSSRQWSGPTPNQPPGPRLCLECSGCSTSRIFLWKLLECEDARPVPVQTASSSCGVSDRLSQLCRPQTPAALSRYTPKSYWNLSHRNHKSS